jgi:hypothetical protein
MEPTRGDALKAFLTWNPVTPSFTVSTSPPVDATTGTCAIQAISCKTFQSERYFSTL